MGRRWMEALAWCLVWLVASELGIGPFLSTAILARAVRRRDRYITSTAHAHAACTSVSSLVQRSRRYMGRPAQGAEWLLSGSRDGSWLPGLGLGSGSQGGERHILRNPRVFCPLSERGSVLTALAIAGPATA